MVRTALAVVFAGCVSLVHFCTSASGHSPTLTLRGLVRTRWDQTVLEEACPAVNVRCPTGECAGHTRPPWERGLPTWSVSLPCSFLRERLSEIKHSLTEMPFTALFIVANSCKHNKTCPTESNQSTNKGQQSCKLG